MIKTLFIMLATAALLFFCLHLVHFDAGSVVIALDTFELHTTFWFFSASLLLIFFACLMIDRLLRLLGSLRHRSGTKLAIALRHLLHTGYWPQAAKMFNRLGLNKHQHHLQGITAYLTETLKPGTHNVDISRLPPLVQGILAMQKADHMLALSIWSNRTLKIPTYLRLVLWLKTLQAANNPEPTLVKSFYDEAKSELRALIKYHPQDMQWLYEQLLNVPRHDIKALWKIWRDMPKAFCEIPTLAMAMAKQLVDMGMARDAQLLLLPHMDKQWTPKLLHTFLHTHTSIQAKHAWLAKTQKTAPSYMQPHLYAAIGILFAEEGDNAQAAKYLGQALMHPHCPNSTPIDWQITQALSLSRLGNTNELTLLLERMKKRQ